MLPYKSFISWKIGPITIQSFGLLFAIGFSVAVFLILKKFRKKKDKDHVQNISIWCIVAGILGARLVYVLQNYYKLSFPEIFRFWDGGLTWYGGFIFATLAAYIYIRKNKLSFWKYADKSAGPLALGQAIGRIGCILGDGGHVGKLTTVAWGFNVNGEVRHVTAWYSAINLVILYFILEKLERKKFFKGFVFIFYIWYYSLSRFIIDILRVDQRYFGLTLTQFICIFLFGVSSYILVKKFK